MRRILAALCGMLGLLGLGGCERYLVEDIRPGVTTRAEVREHLGDPGIEWREADGTVVWEYSMQPAGTKCYQLTIDAGGVVRQVTQVLTEANRQRIVPGMSETQVRRLIGRPARTHYYELKRETAWDWLIDNSAQMERTYFNVYFDPAGTVVRTGQQVEMLGN
jgi:outer membrane protein assembly factor BamE (lipoprotein component of BamABCDE complex)